MDTCSLFPFLRTYYNVKTMRHLLLSALLVSQVASLATPADETAAPPTIYAVIISGGRSRMFNHERYWNDCAFLYSTLRQECDIPKEHITLLMADGDNPANDMLRDGAAGFVSSPTDLDGDGRPDLTLAATRQNVEDVFRRLSMTLTNNDHLFIFITDHGEETVESSQLRGLRRGTATMPQFTGQGLERAVHLWLWGDEQISPDELAATVGLCHPATMNILLGQCYAGAFVTALEGKGRIITTACAANQMSWSCKERPYDEFVYHWTCAVAQHDEQGQPIGSDSDGDGRVSMAEAYDYARQHDRRPETPGITAQPDGLAYRWTFSNIGTESGIQRNSNLEYQSSTIYDLQGRKQ